MLRTPLRDYSVAMTNGDRLDPSILAAQKDQQTVDSSGRLVLPTISGVKVNSPVIHSDHRGRLFEVYPGPNEFWSEPIVYCYMWSIRVNQVKGWGLHVEKTDRYTLISGEIMTVLYDARLDSPTHGGVMKVFLSEQGARQLLIPVGVWHMNVNIAETESRLTNHPTQTYQHANPDRLLLDWDAKEIPVDLVRYFPIQGQAVSTRDCS